MKFVPLDFLYQLPVSMCSVITLGGVTGDPGGRLHVAVSKAQGGTITAENAMCKDTAECTVKSVGDHKMNSRSICSVKFNIVFGVCIAFSVEYNSITSALTSSIPLIVVLEADFVWRCVSQPCLGR